MKYRRRIKRDIVEWDVVNWWKFIETIESKSIDCKHKKVLELGARNGGLSLYYAKKHARVICSDVYGPSPLAHELHQKYKVMTNIEYQAIDATNIPDSYKNQFDFVTFKSVFGGIGAGGNIDKQRKMATNIRKCLKPGGLVIFAENMQASKIHQFFRERFRTYGTRWHYEREKEIEELFGDFELCHKEYCGVLGCFGWKEWMRTVLGRLDTILFERIFPDKWKYIGIFIYKKPEE